MNANRIMSAKPSELRADSSDTALGATDTKAPTEGEMFPYGQLMDAVIMMVDDEPITMEVSQAFLEEAGYRNFVLVDESPKAIDIIEQRRPDVVLLDLMMPEVSGFDILRALRANDDLKHLPVIVLTSSVDSETKLEALELGATDFLAKPVDPSELRLRVRNTLAAKAYQDQLIYCDALTGLPNRRMLMSHLTRVLYGAQSTGKQTAVLHINLDRFHRINDSFGLKGGDEALKLLSSRLQHMVRTDDLITRYSRNNDSGTLSRLGSDEFVIVLTDFADSARAAVVAQRIIKTISQPMTIENCEVFVTARIGIAVYPDDGDDAETLLMQASTATQFAKKSNANAFVYYSEEFNARSYERLSLEGQLQKALKHEEFVLQFQPKIRPPLYNAAGVEALIRWHHPKRGLVPPNDFIPLAEETGLIVPISDWVLRNACRQLSAWHQTGFTRFSMAINVCPQQFGSPSFVPLVEQVLADYLVDPQLLTIELTERVVMAENPANVKKLQQLKDIGVKLSIDDFGTGYSSLSYLKRLPIDELKIDRSFVMEVDKHSEDAAIVSAIIAMAHSLGLTVVAEGVETENQLAFLEQQQCDEYQGFLFCKPKSADDLQLLLSHPFKRWAGGA